MDCNSKSGILIQIWHHTIYKMANISPFSDHRIRTCTTCTNNIHILQCISSVHWKHRKTHWPLLHFRKAERRDQNQVVWVATKDTHDHHQSMKLEWSLYCQTPIHFHHTNCFKNSVATSLPRVFIDSFSSRISLSMSCNRKHSTLDCSKRARNAVLVWHSTNDAIGHRSKVRMKHKQNHLMHMIKPRRICP